MHKTMKLPNLPNGWKPTFIAEVPKYGYVLGVLTEDCLFEFWWDGASEGYERVESFMRRKDFEDENR